MHRFIAELLHPNAKVSSSYFPALQIFWDRLVQYGSSQLVLPAIYCALKRKNLEHHAPRDLVSYLQEITELNKKRNTAILKQIDFLSKIFNRHNINYVFLKGSALLITKPYDATAERMVGDIDVLVSEKDLSRAHQLLIDEGFDTVSNEFSFTKELDFEKHLQRIFHPNYIAAVEIHRKLLDLTLKNLISSVEVLNEKSLSSCGYYIPSKKILWQHAILNWQYNDSGIIRNAIAFRTMLDVLYLESKNDTKNLKNNFFAVKHFYSLISLFFNKYYAYYPLYKLLYKWQLNYSLYNKLNNLYFRIHYLLNIGFLRLKSKAYRKRVFNNPKILVERIINFWNKY
jgi:hypothetical protein